MSNRLSSEKLVVLHTNDVHSYFEQMPKIATAFRERSAAQTGSHILKLDIGDHLDRVRYETEGSLGRANLEIMNATGYEYAVLGNNEGLTFTPGMLEQLYPEFAQFEVIGSNIEEMSSGETPRWMKPYAVVEKGPLRIAIIGVTASYNDFYSLLGWHVTEPETVVARLTEQLRPQVDLVIVMSHLGLGKDQQMARDIPGIDCILGGHTHHLLEQHLKINNTYICAAGKLGYQIGEIEFHFVRNLDSRYEIVQVSGRTIDARDCADDEQIIAIWRSHQATAAAAMKVPFTHLQYPLANRWDAESTLGNLLASSLRQWVDAEIGIVNAGQILNSLAAGSVNAYQLLELCPSPINPCRMILRGSAIRTALEQSLLDEFKERPIQGFGFRGKVLGALCVDGLHIEYNPDAAPYGKIASISCNGQPLNDERDYTVATIDMFTFGIGYLSLKEGREIQFFLPEFLRDILAHYLRDETALANANEKRWTEII